MKTTKKTTLAPSLPPQRPGVINLNNNTLAVLLAPLLLLRLACCAAQPAPDNSPGSDRPAITTSTNAVPKGPATNSATAGIQADLDNVKSKIAAAVKQIQDAVASNEAQHARAVSNVAAQIRGLAATDLAENSPLSKQTDALVEKMRAQISRGRTLSVDPKEEGREIYSQVLLKLEPELAALIDKKSSLAAIRAELLRQANALESKARAIAFAEDADLSVLAAKAIGDVLDEVVRFAGRIDALINKMGNGQPLAID